MKSLTDNIFELSAPYDNFYQGKDKRLLFVCSAGILRSATGANLFAKKGYNTRTCGTHEYALVPLTANLIMWAHQIIFVNPDNYHKALTTFHESSILRFLQDKSQVLNIEDDYMYNDPTLIRLLEEQVVIEK